MTPALSHFWIRRTMRRSPIRCSTNWTSQLCWSLSKKDRISRSTNPFHLLAHNAHPQRIQCVMLAAPGPETITEAQKVLFPYLVKDHPDRVLDDFVLQGRDSQWSLPPI